MLIGYNFFKKGIDGNYFDNALPTDDIDKLTLGQGVYDEVFFTVDMTTSQNNEKPDSWRLKHIMDAKFENDLEAGSLDANGYIIDKIELYRRKIEAGANWVLVGRTDYNKEFNTYTFIDKTIQNNEVYEYAIVPISKQVIGELTTSDPVKVEFEGVFVSDLENNYRMSIDYEVSDITYHRNKAQLSPLNGKYPIVIYGNQDYSIGSVSFLPVTEEQIQSAGTDVNSSAERKHREQVVRFLNSGGAKIIRNDNGSVLLVSVKDVKSTPKAEFLPDIHRVTFDFVEVGEVKDNTLAQLGLVGQALKSKYVYDEKGEIIWNTTEIV